MTDIAVVRLRCEHLTDPLGLHARAPRLGWVVQAERRGVAVSAHQVLVASSADLLAADTGDLWDSGQLPGAAGTLVPYAGAALASRQAGHWKVRVWDEDGRCSAWSSSARFEMGLLDPSDWVADWISVVRPPAGEPDRKVAPYFRSEFLLPEEPVTRARAYVSALGLYDLHLNGSRLSDDVFRPGWTDYDKRIQYQVYDITDRLRPGPNVIGAVVGDGWYAGDIGMGKREVWGSWPELLVQVEVDTADGERVIVRSDAAWAECGAPATWLATNGPIVSNDLQLGESYDARLELGEWSSPGYDAGDWKPPFPGGGPVGSLSPTVAEPVRRIEEIVPGSLVEQAPGTWVFDLGQNMVGWCRLRVSGPAGTTVTIRHAEMLDPDGSIHTANLRGALSTDHYTLAGTSPEEVWEPRFTFHGFRYVELTGLPGTPTLDSVTGVVAHSDAPTAGTFTCSNALVNQIHSNVRWGQKGNFVDVPTDCPQRDERLGWMGDAQVFVGTATFNLDVAAFFTKWLRDVRDAQLENGAYPDVCPRFGRSNPPAAPAWGDAGIIVPWTLYRRYGDIGILADHIESMEGWIDYLHRRNPELLWQHVRGMDWGDWVAIGADSPKDVLASAWWAYSTRLLAQAEAVLGRLAPAKRYSDLAEGIRQAWNDAYVKPDGTIEGATQTVYALALRFGLLDEHLRLGAAARLVADIEDRDGHLSTGFMGIAHLLPALTENGALDVAYRLLQNDTFPSWGYSIRQGATTIWERWDGWTEESGFEASGMNSFNHYAFGAVGEWLYETVGGIRVDHTAPAVVTIHPRPGAGIVWARTTYPSIHGDVACSWALQDGVLTVDATVPVGPSAQIWLPAPPGAAVTEGGVPADEADGLTALPSLPEAHGWTAAAGTYHFMVESR